MASALGGAPNESQSIASESVISLSKARSSTCSTPMMHREYSVVATNKNLSLLGLMHFANGRGFQEKVIAELKSGYAFDAVTSRRYAANTAWQKLNIFTHNIATSKQLDTGAAPKNALAPTHDLVPASLHPLLAVRVAPPSRSFAPAGGQTAPSPRLPSRRAGALYEDRTTAPMRRVEITPGLRRRRRMGRRLFTVHVDCIALPHRAAPAPRPTTVKRRAAGLPGGGEHLSEAPGTPRGSSSPPRRRTRRELRSRRRATLLPVAIRSPVVEPAGMSRWD
jgi:hypothetical protein